MLKEIKKNISNFRKQRYQKILFSKKDILLRNKAIKYICGLEIKIGNNKKDSQSYKFYLQYLKKKKFYFIL